MGLKKLFDSGYKEMKRCEKLAYKIEALDEQMQKLSDDELKAKTPYLKELLKNGKTLNDILVEAYAVAREAAYRVTGMKAYHVQLIGACAIHGGNISEMKTGEGKTLTAVFPAYLNALSGNGVHIVTVNEYLAGREANGEIGEIYKFLGLSVGLNLRELDRQQKRDAYSCDIMYSTNSELGFDYLRDNMVPNINEITQVKGLNYAIIDEVDSILIDDARTPLIISGPTKDDNGLYEKADTFVKMLTTDDYNIDIESRTISLNPSGVEKAEKFFRVKTGQCIIFKLIDNSRCFTQFNQICHSVQNDLCIVWFWHKICSTMRKCHDLFFCSTTLCHDNDRYHVKMLILFDFRKKSITVHNRHHHIKKYQCQCIRMAFRNGKTFLTIRSLIHIIFF